MLKNRSATENFGSPYINLEGKNLVNRKGLHAFRCGSYFGFFSACLSLQLERCDPPAGVANIILGKVGFPSSGAGASGVYDTILLFVRLPRTLMVFFVGSVLGVTGAVYQ